MTTVIAIKCLDGIVLASDSQSTSQVLKDPNISKIFKINDSMGIGTAGDERHIRVLTEELQENIKQQHLDSEKILRKQIRDILLNLHSEYNVKRSQLEKIPIHYFFQPYGLLGTRLNDGSFCLHNITPEPWVHPIDNFQSIGSGFPLATLVLTQQSRIPKLENKKLSDLPLNMNVWIASYAINEVKAIEHYTGGDTKIAFIDKEGFKEIPDEEQKKFYQETANLVSNELEKRLLDGTNKIKFEKMFPNN